MPQVWTDFPSSYIHLINRFRTEGSFSLGPFTRKDAVAVRTQIYRFRDCVRLAINSFTSLGEMPPDDLVDIHETFIGLVTSLDQSADGHYKLTLKQDPLVDWALREPVEPVEPVEDLTV